MVPSAVDVYMAVEYAAGEDLSGSSTGTSSIRAGKTAKVSRFLKAGRVVRILRLLKLVKLGEFMLSNRCARECRPPHTAVCSCAHHTLQSTRTRTRTSRCQPVCTLRLRVVRYYRYVGAGLSEQLSVVLAEHARKLRVGRLLCEILLCSHLLASFLGMSAIFADHKIETWYALARARLTAVLTTALAHDCIRALSAHCCGVCLTVARASLWRVPHCRACLTLARASLWRGRPGGARTATAGAGTSASGTPATRWTTR